MRHIWVIITLSVCLWCHAEDGLKPDEDLKIYYEGDKCDIDGITGNCTKIHDCKQAVLDLKQNIHPKHCGFQGTDPLVCCAQDASGTEPRINGEECKFQYGLKCEKTQRKSHDACVKYQEARCPTAKFDPTTASGGVEENGPQVSYGEDAREGQFAYMALLGFGNSTSDAQWLCGGSIISEKFILTAGHCTGSQTTGPVSFAVVGTLRRSDPIQDGRLFKVKNIFKHPDYHPPHKYNDIALLELDRNITFDNVIQPACLYSFGDTDEICTVVGWGTVGHLREAANVLQYADIHKFSDEECSKLYTPGRLLKQGFNSSTQLCYGHREIPKDTCQGDSGGPLQASSYNMFPCIPTVIGVTSFGKECGHVGMPGIYTRVETYLPWIESVVWP